MNIMFQMPHPIVYYLELFVWMIMVVYVAFLDPLSYKRMILRLKIMRFQVYTLYAMAFVNDANPITRLIFLVNRKGAALWIIRMMLTQSSYRKELEQGL